MKEKNKCLQKLHWKPILLALIVMMSSSLTSFCFGADVEIADGNDSLPITVSGVVKNVAYEHASNGEKITSQVLILDKAITVSAKWRGQGDAQRVERVQFQMPSGFADGAHVTVTGPLFPALTAWYIEDFAFTGDVHVKKYHLPIKVILDGKTLSFDQPPVKQNGRAMVPLRGISEALGAKVDWNQQTKEITIMKGSNTIWMTMGKKVAYKNGLEMKLDSPVYAVNGRTMVPARFVAESFGAKVDWDEENQVVSIISFAGMD